MAKRYQVPKSAAEAVRRWGRSGTVSIDLSKLREDMQVLMTFEKKKASMHDRYALSYLAGEYDEPVGVRFSGDPEALLDMFRMLHIEYARRRGRGPRATKNLKRSIILDVEDKCDGD